MPNISHVQGADIQLLELQKTDYTSMTDMVKNFGDSQLIYKSQRLGLCLAFEFGTWLSPVFKLYLIRQFQKLKETQNKGDA